MWAPSRCQKRQTLIIEGGRNQRFSRFKGGGAITIRKRTRAKDPREERAEGREDYRCQRTPLDLRIGGGGAKKTQNGLRGGNQLGRRHTVKERSEVMSGA